MADFEAWVTLMLLDALQRHGWFRTAGETQSMDALRAGCVPAYARFVPEAIGILQIAGMQSRSRGSMSAEAADLLQIVLVSSSPGPVATCSCLLSSSVKLHMVVYGTGQGLHLVLWPTCRLCGRGRRPGCERTAARL